MPVITSTPILYGMGLMKLTPKSEVALAQSQCTICLGPFLNQQEIYRLPHCEHNFHRFCIVPWFWKENTCPSCHHRYPDLIVQEFRQFSIPITDPETLQYYRQSTSVCQEYGTNNFCLNFYTTTEKNKRDEPLRKLLILEGFEPEFVDYTCGPYYISPDIVLSRSMSEITL